MDRSALILKKLNEINEKLFSQSNEYLNNKQVCARLNISKRTLMNWRSKNIIPFSQIGEKIYYKLSDIDLMMQQYYKPAKQWKPVSFVKKKNRWQNIISDIIIGAMVIILIRTENVKNVVWGWRELKTSGDKLNQKNFFQKVALGAVAARQ